MSRSYHLERLIPNDSKLFAQSILDKTISYFVTSDVRSKIR